MIYIKAALQTILLIVGLVFIVTLWQQYPEMAKDIVGWGVMSFVAFYFIYCVFCGFVNFNERRQG